jgi:hypothetical protein
MKQSDVHIGKHYTAKVTHKLVVVEILAENPQGGWDARNLATGKSVRIKSAQHLRGPAAAPPTSAPVARSRQKASTDTPPQPSPNTAQPAPNKRLSALDAAAQVLAETAKPMTCRELIDVMAAKSYWTPSQSGKTPQNTLHAAISKEIKVKGPDSRFEKTGRGQFTLSTQ